MDCVYTIVCDPNTKKGAICNADDGKAWDVNGCPNSDINLMQGCEMKKGDSLDISNLMHREYYNFFYTIYKKIIIEIKLFICHNCSQWSFWNDPKYQGLR